MSLHRSIVAGLAAAAIATATVVSTAPRALAGPDAAGEGHQPAVAERMHELMTSGNPGMARMHELMMSGNSGMARMHESVMRRAD